MMFEGPIDLVEVDRKIARAHEAAVRALGSLATEEGRELARRADPFRSVREVTGQTAFRAIQSRELPAGSIDAPLRDGLLRWVHELLQTRVAWDLFADEADATHLPDPTLNPRAADGVPKTYDESLTALVVASHERAAEAAYRRLADLALPVSAVRNELRDRRFEVSRRLGLDHPWALATSDLGKLFALARALLDATEPLATELRKELTRRLGDSSAPFTIFDAFGRSAEEGWPARLSTRWLEDTFRAIVQRAPRQGALPQALGGASFLRAADAWGRALRLAGTARSLPFALARDPYATEPPTLGTTLARTVAGPVFAKRKLGLTDRATEAHVRTLGRVLFFTLRKRAAEVALGAAVRDDGDGTAELGGRVFGSPLGPALGSCWAFGGLAGISRRADVIAGLPAALVGAVRSFDLTKNLTDRFDEDWFDNPRAGAHLASIGAGPVWHGDVPEPDEAARISRMFEEMLG